MAAKFIANDRIVPWLKELQDKFKVLVPSEENGTIVYRVFDGETRPALDKPANMPPKASVFPQTEVLLRYKYDRRSEDGTRNLEVEEVLPDESCLVFGTSPCGSRGFQAFDPVYKGKTVDDPYFIRRREKAVFVAVTCTRPTTTCFCHWVGSGPADPDGSDVLLTPVEGGYVAEAVTEKGKALMDTLASAEDAGKRLDEAEKVKAATVKALGEPESLEGAPEKVLAAFDNLEFWEKEAARCISCGACTFFCPTCYCFNITDETSGLAGERIRTWDSCMFPLFTREASGHNPRPTKGHRLRNRVQHKFAYYPGIHGGRFSCTGCGRCIRQCPSGVDIRRIVQNAMKLASEAEGDK